MQQVQRLAAIHDPTGRIFNVSSVVTLDDGKVVTQEALRRRQEKAAERVTDDEATGIGEGSKSPSIKMKTQESPPVIDFEGSTNAIPQNGLNPDRMALIEGQPQTENRSKSQMRKLVKFDSRPPPPRPTIPEHISLPEGEEDWLCLWDLDDEQLECRVMRQKKRRAAERKALRVRQQSGKAERRTARDEKRKIYRDIKLEWKAIKGCIRRPAQATRADILFRRTDP